MLSRVFVVALCLSLVAAQTGGGCGTNSETYCLNERQYIGCGPVDPTERRGLFTCPLPGQFCADVLGTCTSDTGIAQTENTMCGVCSTGLGKGHTCTGYNSFEICTDGQFDITDENFCAPGRYCDVFHPNPDNPCSPFTGHQLLCWKPHQPQPPKTIEDICQEKGEGRFPIETDATCRSFLVCQRTDDKLSWLASTLQCSNTFVFSPEHAVCVPSFIYTCPVSPGANALKVAFAALLK